MLVWMAASHGQARPGKSYFPAVSGARLAPWHRRVESPHVPLPDSWQRAFRSASFQCADLPHEIRRRRRGGDGARRRQCGRTAPCCHRPRRSGGVSSGSLNRVSSKGGGTTAPKSEGGSPETLSLAGVGLPEPGSRRESAPSTLFDVAEQELAVSSGSGPPARLLGRIRSRPLASIDVQIRAVGGQFRPQSFGRPRTGLRGSLPPPASTSRRAPSAALPPATWVWSVLFCLRSPATPARQPR